MAELSDINKSGELTEIKLSGTADSDKVAKIEDIESKIGPTVDVQANYLVLTPQPILSVHPQGTIGCYDETLNKVAFNDGVGWKPLAFADEITGATGSFTAQSGETVTVVNGLITEIT